MAIKIECNKVYKCQSPGIACASVHVVSGTVNILGSNVTENDENGKLVVPSSADLVSTGDDALTGNEIRLIAGLPEWFCFSGDAEVWIKMGVDLRIEPGE